MRSKTAHDTTPRKRRTIRAALSAGLVLAAVLGVSPAANAASGWYDYKTIKNNPWGCTTTDYYGRFGWIDNDLYAYTSRSGITCLNTDNAKVGGYISFGSKYAGMANTDSFTDTRLYGARSSTGYASAAHHAGAAGANRVTFYTGHSIP